MQRAANGLVRLNSRRIARAVDPLVMLVNHHQLAPRQVLACRDFADAQKAPDLIAEVGERVVVDAWGVIPVASRRAEHRSDNIMT